MRHVIYGSLEGLSGASPSNTAVTNWIIHSCIANSSWPHFAGSFPK